METEISKSLPCFVKKAVNSIFDENLTAYGGSKLKETSKKKLKKRMTNEQCSLVPYYLSPHPREERKLRPSELKRMDSPVIFEVSLIKAYQPRFISLLYFWMLCEVGWKTKRV